LNSLNATVQINVKGAYIVINNLFPVCVKPKANATAALDDMSPQSLLSMSTSNDVAHGKLVGEETLNGATVKHDVLDGNAFLAAAQKSKNPKLRAFSESPGGFMVPSAGHGYRSPEGEGLRR
jgi:hypothetical protein